MTTTDPDPCVHAVCEADSELAHAALSRATERLREAEGKLAAIRVRASAPWLLAILDGTEEGPAAEPLVLPADEWTPEQIAEFRELLEAAMKNPGPLRVLSRIAGTVCTSTQWGVAAGDGDPDGRLHGVLEYDDEEDAEAHLGDGDYVVKRRVDVWPWERVQVIDVGYMSLPAEVQQAIEEEAGRG